MLGYPRLIFLSQDSNTIICPQLTGLLCDLKRKKKKGKRPFTWTFAQNTLHKPHTSRAPRVLSGVLFKAPGTLNGNCEGRTYNINKDFSDRSVSGHGRDMSHLEKSSHVGFTPH